MSEYQVESEVEERREEGSEKRWASTKREGLFTPLDFDILCFVFGMHCVVTHFRKMVEAYGAVEGVVRIHRM